MFGVYESFPENIHLVWDFVSSLSRKQLQQKLVQVLEDLNRRKFSFEDVCSPTVPQCTIIFEVGIADSRSFNYLSPEETQKVLEVLKKKDVSVIDFFTCIRYYKTLAPKKTPLKFDYYMIRSLFNENQVEFQTFHERGPRYVSPQEFVTFLVRRTNEAAVKPILKLVESA